MKGNAWNEECWSVGTIIAGPILGNCLGQHLDSSFYCLSQSFCVNIVDATPPPPRGALTILGAFISLKL